MFNGDAIFTAVVDESGTPHLPQTDGMSSYFSVGILIAADPGQLRRQVIAARAECKDPKVRKRGYFHASDDNRYVRQYLCDHLKHVLFDFGLWMVDKSAAVRLHQIRDAKALHQLLLREAINSSISYCCRSVNLLVGTHPQTLKSEAAILEVLKYHQKQQILEAINFPIGRTIRTRFNSVQMVSPLTEPLMDVVDYLIWTHQREEFKNDEHWHVFLRGSRLRAHFGGSERFPGIVRIRSCSNWFPKDPILESMPFRTLSRFGRNIILPNLLNGIDLCLRRGQNSLFLGECYSLARQLLEGDRRSETSLNFGRALFEVIDTEAIPLQLWEHEFNIIKRGAAICAWIVEKGSAPPVENWPKLLEEFFSLVTGQEAQISYL